MPVSELNKMDMEINAILGKGKDLKVDPLRLASVLKSKQARIKSNLLSNFQRL